MERVHEMSEYTLEDLSAIMRDRFGEDDRAWAWECPSCGDIANGYDFAKALDGDWGKASTRVGRECIGRSLGALNKDQAYVGRGCDWAAYGLFAGPNVLIREGADGEEKRLYCFNIAPAPVEAKAGDSK